jgi:hypothetical protein
MTELTVSNATDWQPQFELLKLPSGKVVKVKEVDLQGMILRSDQGVVPDFIRAQISAKMTGSKAPATKLDPDNLGEMGQMLDLIALSSVVEPKIVRSGAEYFKGEINVDDMSTEDKLFLMSIMMPSQEMDVATTFRQRIENANLGVVPAVPNNGKPTKRRAPAKK